MGEGPRIGKLFGVTAFVAFVGFGCWCSVQNAKRDRMYRELAVGTCHHMVREHGADLRCPARKSP